MTFARFLIVRVSIARVAVTVRSPYGGYEPGAVAVRAGVLNPIVPFIAGRPAAYAFAAVPNVAFTPNFAAERAAAAVPIMPFIAHFTAEAAAAAVPLVFVRLHFAAATAVQQRIPVVPARFAFAANCSAPEKFQNKTEKTIEEVDKQESDKNSSQHKHNSPIKMIGRWFFKSAQNSPAYAIDNPSDEKRDWYANNENG